MQPDEELYERAEKAVRARLSGRRLEHVLSVADYAPELAQEYGVNTFDARLAGLLHDWDKLLVDDELPARMEEFGIEKPDYLEYLYPVIHSFTGAEAVRREFPEVSEEIISAIWHHTLGGKEMSDLDKVIFIADIIEPLRQADKRPQVQKLRDMVGLADLEMLYFNTYAETMRSLINRKRFIHPLAFDIWNDLIEKHHPVDKLRQGNADIVL